MDPTRLFHKIFFYVYLIGVRFYNTPPIKHTSPIPYTTRNMRFSISNTISTLSHHLLHPRIQDDVFTITQTNHLTDTLSRLLHELSMYTTPLQFVFHVHRVYTDSLNTLLLWFAIVADDGFYTLSIPGINKVITFDSNYADSLHKLTFFRSPHFFYRPSLPYYPPFSALYSDVHSAYTAANAMSHAVQQDVLSRIHLPDGLVYY